MHSVDLVYETASFSLEAPDQTAQDALRLIFAFTTARIQVKRQQSVRAIWIFHGHAALIEKCRTPVFPRGLNGVPSSWFMLFVDGLLPAYAALATKFSIGFNGIERYSTGRTLAY